MECPDGDPKSAEHIPSSCTARDGSSNYGLEATRASLSVLLKWMLMH